MLRYNSLLAIAQLQKEQVEELLKRAENFENGTDTKKYLEGKIQYNLFYEPSTRTNYSFLEAGERLGAKVRVCFPEFLSERKGEEFLDTIRAYEALGANILVVRRWGALLPSLSLGDVVSILRDTELIFISAGSTRDHPTQALVDLYTLKRHVLKEKRWEDLHVIIFGDLANSRVGHSDKELFEMFGIQVTECQTDEELNENLGKVDAVIVLRQQRGLGKSPQLTSSMVEEHNPNIFIMHPGPVIWDKEVDLGLAKHSQTLILEQVRLSIYMRMAVLSCLKF